MAESDCSKDLERQFFDADLPSGPDRKWKEISVREMGKAVKSLDSCQKLVKSGKAYPKLKTEIELPKLTNCQKEHKEIENVRIDPATYFLPKCDDQTGDYEKYQSFNLKNWCVADTKKSSQPAKNFLKFYQKVNYWFCLSLKFSPCYRNDSNYCKNKMCQFSDRNLIYKHCGSDCETVLSGTCEAGITPGEPRPGNCNKMCVQGCFCKDGYVLDKKLRKCVRKENFQVEFNFRFEMNSL